MFMQQALYMLNNRISPAVTAPFLYPSYSPYRRKTSLIPCKLSQLSSQDLSLGTGVLVLSHVTSLSPISSSLPLCPLCPHTALAHALSSSACRDGYNAWRDAFRPSQILAGLCQRCGLPAPEYRAGAVKVGNRVFLTPSEALPSGTRPSLLGRPQRV